MKKFILIFILAHSFILNAQEYIVATDVWEPFRIESGSSLVGIDIDIIKYIETETGLNFTISRMPWARCLKSMEDGSADIMIGLAYTDERNEYIEYLNPDYFTISIGFYTNDKSIEINEFRDLKNRTIGYVTGSSYFNEFDNSEELEKISVPQESQLLKMLYRGNVDIIIGTRIQIDYEIKRNGWKDKLFPGSYNPTDGVKLYLGISRKSPLLEHKSKIEEAIIKLINSDIDRIIQEYQ